MQKLMKGVHRFQSLEMGQYCELFQKLSHEGQKPHTLFITCSDSRVLAELITQSQPGDLFVVKNVGNIIPTSDVTGSTNSTAAAIEFALNELKVQDIVVCGHSQCGAINALVTQAFAEENDEAPVDDGMPHLRRWLRIAAPVKEVIRRDFGHLMKDPDALIHAATEENVLYALENLRTYPGVQEGVEAGTLRLHAWYFKIVTAEIFAFDHDAKEFRPLVAAEVLAGQNGKAI